MLKKYIFVVLLVCSSVALAAEPKYTTYQNSAAEYEIAVPLELLYPQGESENHMGQTFKSADNTAKLLTYGMGNPDDKILDDLYAEALNPEDKDERVFTYKILGNDWFVVTGFHKKKVFYKKTILSSSSGMILSFYFEYPKAKRALYDQMTVKMSKSFKEIK